jgi:hypothetical protein
VAVGENEDIMVCEMPEDKQALFTSLIFTRVRPNDTRIKPFDPDACQDLSEVAAMATD